jgi:hypothetical protein
MVLSWRKKGAVKKKQKGPSAEELSQDKNYRRPSSPVPL